MCCVVCFLYEKTIVFTLYFIPCWAEYYAFSVPFKIRILVMCHADANSFLFSQAALELKECLTGNFLVMHAMMNG